MDAALKQQIVQEAREYWDGGQPYQAGRTLFEHIPLESRHTWAYQLLMLARPYFPRDPQVEAILEFTRCPQSWGQGRPDPCDQARRIIHDVDARRSHSPIFALAAQAGKLSYTAQRYPQPFDHDAGWKLAVPAWHIARKSCDNELAGQLWSALANQGLLLLDLPIMCHPACPTCAANGLTSARAAFAPAMPQIHNT